MTWVYGHRRAKPPIRLIDLDGEGVLMLSANGEWGLRDIALEFFGDARQWCDLDLRAIWMREDDEETWHPWRWRWWHAFLPRRWQPTLYMHVTPKPEPAVLSGHRRGR